MLANLESSVVVVVDIQPKFMNGIVRATEVQSRAEYLVNVAQLLGIPVLATEQNPDRMGGTAPSIKPDQCLAKMAFSCCGADGFTELLSGKSQVILIGIETHICVTQTALQLREQGKHVFVPIDAVSARSELSHSAGLNRMSGAQVELTHTESLAYEWMRSADHPAFREVLKLTIAYA